MDLRNENCIDGLDKLQPNSVDLLLTDPPYFLPAMHYQTRRQFARNLADLSILEFFFDAVLAKCIRVLKETAFIYIFCDGQSYPIFYVKLYQYVKSLRPLVWDKMTSINGYSWRHQHELILFAEMPKAPPIKTGDGDILKHRAVKIDDRIHPAQKPLPLLSDLIEKSCPAKGVVLDPFMGSGATGEACEYLGRQFIGFEIDKKYYEQAKAKLG